MAELCDHRTGEGDPLNIILLYPLHGAAGSSAPRFGARAGGNALPARTTFGPSQPPSSGPSYAQKPFVKTGLNSLRLTPGLAWALSAGWFTPACLGPPIAESVLGSRNAAPSLGERLGRLALRRRPQLAPGSGSGSILRPPSNCTWLYSPYRAWLPLQRCRSALLSALGPDMSWPGSSLQVPEREGLS